MLNDKTAQFAPEREVVHPTKAQASLKDFLVDGGPPSFPTVVSL